MIFFFVLELLFSFSIFVLLALCCIVRSLFYVTGEFHRFLHRGLPKIIKVKVARGYLLGTEVLFLNRVLGM